MGYSIPSLVRFGQLLDPMKGPIFKIRHSRNSQVYNPTEDFEPDRRETKNRPHANYVPNMRCTKKIPAGGNRLTGVSTGQGGVHLMRARGPHLRIIVRLK